MSPEQLDIKCSSYRDNCKLFVVGVGASAGGLQALEKFFKNMPSDSGAAFVVIQHLSPNFKSLMKELLERHTQMEIHRVTDGMKLAANSIFLIPKDKNIILEGNKLRLVKRESRTNLKPNFPIDLFFDSFNLFKNLPVNYLKIDGSFIKEIHTETVTKAMVQAINYLAEALGIKTIVEFAENQDIVDILKELQVDYAQGYHYGKPNLFNSSSFPILENMGY